MIFLKKSITPPRYREDQLPSPVGLVTNVLCCGIRFICTQPLIIYGNRKSISIRKIKSDFRRSDTSTVICLGIIHLLWPSSL